MADISVIIPSFNSIQTIKEAFESVTQQNYLEGSVEYIFIDGASSDGTLEYLQERSLERTEVKVLICKDGLSASRNLGVHEAKYSLLAFTDSDCRVPQDWLQTMKDVYVRWKEKDERLAGVGGSNIPPEGSGYFYRALETMKNSYIGSHGSVYGMSFKDEQYLPHIATVNALYERSILLEYPFDEKMIRISEDADVTWRLLHDGYRFVYNPKGTVWHSLRPTVWLWIRNMFLYGQGRVMLFRKFPAMMLERPVLLGPMLLTLSLFFSLPALWIPIFALPFSLYCILTSAISFSLVLKKQDILLLPLVIFLFFLSHTAYGLGQWNELFFSTQEKRGEAKARLNL